jgi:hypothetical protein
LLAKKDECSGSYWLGKDISKLMRGINPAVGVHEPANSASTKQSRFNLEDEG